jgi:hypothetical protein
MIYSFEILLQTKSGTPFATVTGVKKEGKGTRNELHKAERSHETNPSCNREDELSECMSAVLESVIKFGRALCVCGTVIHAIDRKGFFMNGNIIISLADEIAHGDSLKLIDLARRFNVAVSTCFRWVTKGLPNGDGARVKLEALKRGKCWLTSECAVRRFFTALPQAVPAVASIRTPSKRARDASRAQQTLKTKYGI